MSATRVRCLVLVALAAFVGCGKTPEQTKGPAEPAGTVPPVRVVPPVEPTGPGNDHLAPPPHPARDRPFVGFRRVPVTADEQAEFVAHIPGAVRGQFGTDADLFKELGGVAYAWDFTGGPVRLSVAFEEEGQSTVPKHYPERENAWTVNSEKGRVVFWMRRGASDKVNAALAQAKRPTGDASSVALGVMASPGGFDATVARTNALWYGWKGHILSESPPEATRLPDDDAVVIPLVRASEVAGGAAKPRQVRVMLVAQRVQPE